MTTPLLGDLVSALVGLIVLTLGADLLVRGASALASRARVPPLLVGLTVVALGTSAPEIAVSVDAAIGGRGDVSLGNVVGSNIFNVLFILGASALAAPLVVKSRVVRLDVPVMVGVSALPLLMGLDGVISRGNGVALLLLLVGYLAMLGIVARRGGGVGAADGERAAADGGSSPLLDLALALGGVVLLVLGADALVEGATALARAAGVSELVVGLTIVAAGTSLPELATSLVASLRGQRDLAVGNVVGSNIFNVLAVLGAGAAVSGGLEVAPGLLRFDFPVMIAVGFACLPVFMTGAAITRVEGAVFLAYYLVYAVYLGLHTADHPFQEEFGIAVLGVVLPLTIAVAAALWMRGREEEERAEG